MSVEKHDGAVEKLMEEGNKTVENVGDKYDELKLDVSDHKIETAYAGMGKEELMKYANSPFWVRLRWLLFVIFWMSWLAMMIGAVFIIFMTPKCVKSSKLEWYQKSPVYVINASFLVNNSSLSGLNEKIEYMQKLGVQNVVLSSVLYTDKDGVIDFNKTNEYLGDPVLTNLITELKTNGMKVMLKFSPIHSSQTNIFFIRSIDKEPMYKDYYIWKNSSFDNGCKLHPNNDMSTVNGESHWTWQEKRKECYFHQFSTGEPDLNFRNKDVVNYFEAVFKEWLKLGFDGFYLSEVQYLFKDFGNNTEINNTSIKSLNHKGITSSLPETKDLLSTWGNIIKKNSGILIVSDLNFMDTMTGVNIVHNSTLLPTNFTAETLRDTILPKTSSSSWSSWEWVCSNTSNPWKNETIDAFSILGSLLPGTPVIIADPKLFKDHNVPKITIFEETLKYLRSLLTIELSPFSMKLLNDDTTFAFDRQTGDSERLLFAWNLSNNVTTLNLSPFGEIPAEVYLSLCTQSACSNLPPLKSKVKSDSISLAAGSAVVLNF